MEKETGVGEMCKEFLSEASESIYSALFWKSV